MTVNPFRPAEQVAPKVKALIYGPSGVGKTYLALTAPGRIAVIDTEGGTAFYADRVGKGGLSPFDVLPTKTFAQVEQAIAYLRDNPTAYATLVIDPVTVLYETLQDAAQMRRQDIMRRSNKPGADDADLEMLDWQRIKRAYKRLMTDLVNLPMNVVVTARENELTEERVNQTGRKERVKIGFKPDAEKSTAYYFDVVLRLVPAQRSGREALVEKDRTGTHALGARLASPSFDGLFSKAIEAGASATGSRSLQSDDEAARIDANTTMVAAELEEKDELLTEVGSITRTGAVARGDGRRSDLEARQMPNGWHIGLRLELGDNKAIPQVVAEGELGTALYEHTGYDTGRLFGERVTVHGTLYEVRKPGRRMIHRLVLTRIEADGWAIPAATETESEPEATEATEAPSAELFDDSEMAAINAAVDAA